MNQRTTTELSFSIKDLFDLDQQFTQKLEYLDFNDSKLSCFWTLFSASKFERCLRSFISDEFGPECR